MKFSEKILLRFPHPTEEHPVSYHQLLLQTLSDAGFPNAKVSLSVLQKLYSIYQINSQTNTDLYTATLVYQEYSWTVIFIEAGDTRDTHYGLAVDYGSTTIIMQLVNLNTGEILAQSSEPNGQIIYGTDILSRITYTMETSAHMDDLQKVTVETFDKLLHNLTEISGIQAADCPVLIISGNTTMIHFLLKLDARTVFFAPYAPVTMNPGWFSGQELGMHFNGICYIIPAASNYVGGDIISGLLTLDFYKKDDISMFFDIGTNGELVIGNNQWLIAGAGAAGPALEGYISKSGMRAQNGAVDTVSIKNNHLFFTTINDEKPIGICGSGIIDLIAQMRLHGWINIAGKLNPEASDRIRYITEEEDFAVVYATEEESQTGEPLYFTQTDIEQYLDTKAAAFTMIDSLLGTIGCSETDIQHCYLSGAFSAHSNLESAITVGIFPDLPRDRYTGIVNSSLDGARTLLLDQTRMEDIQYLTETMYCVQFASIPDFLIKMQAAKFIPHTDMNRFPYVNKMLASTENNKRYQ